MTPRNGFAHFTDEVKTVRGVLRLVCLSHNRDEDMEEKLLSVGIDIGTSTTQVIFSEIVIENIASIASVPRIRVIEKRLVYTGEIHRTPLLSPVEIDASAVATLVEGEYKRAGFLPKNIDTGAVIITGETARKNNAAAVQKSLAGFAGDFVVAVAGPALEGIIAGKGAGADRESKERGAVVANVDIGGGTTNIAVFDNGQPITTSCLDIGGHLITFVENSTIVASISQPLQRFAAAKGITIQVGQKADGATLVQLMEMMADVLDQILGVAPWNTASELLITDHPLKKGKKIDFISFSGGVADCMEQGEREGDGLSQPYNDIGCLLGSAIGKSKAASIPRFTARETIRATVVGAGTHTTEISGSTIDFAEEVLPLQNIPVIRLSAQEEESPFSEWAAHITEKLSFFDSDDDKELFALSFKGKKAYGFREIQELAAVVADGVCGNLSPESPLIVVVERDFGKALGQALRAYLGERGTVRNVVCLDGIKVKSGDYIDIGRGISRGKVVPVIVKTLVFGY